MCTIKESLISCTEFSMLCNGGWCCLVYDRSFGIITHLDMIGVPMESPYSHNQSLYKSTLLAIVSCSLPDFIIVMTSSEEPDVNRWWGVPLWKLHPPLMAYCQLLVLDQAFWVQNSWRDEMDTMIIKNVLWSLGLKIQSNFMFLDIERKKIWIRTAQIPTGMGELGT